MMTQWPRVCYRGGSACARRIGPRDLELLSEYAWPGNVRELATVIDRAVLLGEGRTIEVARSLGLSPRAGTSMRSPVVAETAARTIESLDSVIKRHVVRALELCHGRIDGPFGVARQLQKNPHTLRAKMKKLGIDWRRYRPS